MRLLVKNIARIVGIESTGRLRCCGADMNKLGTLDDAWLLAEDGRFAAFGRMDSLGDIAADEVVDAAGGMLFPSFCDSHTHLVYAGSREREFLDKINGLSYEEIARRGGGILNSADRLHETSEDELYAQAMERVREIAAMGTGCVEIKSGYGLSTGDELKMLRVIRRIRESVPLEVRATFLGAHAVARAYRGRQGEYVDLVCNEMLPAVAAEGLADFVDVFCDEGFFTVEETARILKAARKLGLRAKIHANELAVSGGVQVGVACDALSVDHLERMGREEIEALSSLSISSFDTMELRYYPNTMDEKLGEPVRTYMGGLLEDLRSYAEEFDHNSESLMLFGNAGLGKTHAALAIAGIVLQKDFDVIYVSSPDFFGKLENARFDSSEDAETLLRTASAADLLILDDLGTEFVTPYFITTFYSLLNNRLGAGLPTIVTTNIADGSLLEKRYTEKISSRLSSFVPCLFAGEDIRGLKAAE